MSSSGHSLTLSRERQSVSDVKKYNYDGLIWSDTGCFTHMATVGVKGLTEQMKDQILDAYGRIPSTQIAIIKARTV